ncbi:vWA domain-containing protein [Staphylothermus hellenicus]|uniref:von Willebrand factor type A n=1 Tax=Staphylothermus hellenicus (strain DSM 12710 / JCM 10830 / BK20S6-10-b1 / P8) TaxID=591019 RepID=D7D8P2_STAHD|nr:VWA domain-containing protein [Staphylothermus hellenicus]ADI32138.1 von Willebrand factor type A [Staphylothermus hellenicus DSM 12710]
MNKSFNPKTKSIDKDELLGVLSSISYDDPVVKYRGSKVIKIAKLIAEKDLKIPLSLAIDIFYVFYLPMPILKPKDNISRNKRYHYKIIDSLLKSSFIHDIRSKTIVDGLMSSIAASIFISELKQLENERSYGNAASNRRGEEGGEEGEKAIRRNVEKAIANTMRDVENAKKLRMLIEGERPGTVSIMAYEEYGPELIRLARNVEVRKILEILTGMKPWNISIPERKQRFKHGELMSYELGKDIERIVPSTLALPDELFYLRFLENRLLLYQKMLSQGKGPLYVLLDKSGSMDGTKMTWAKAVALSLYMRAVREHREFYFRFFDSIPYPLAKISRRPRASNVLKLIDYIARVRGSGGTDISKAIITACNDIRTSSVRNTSDIILITDGVDRIAEQLVTYNLRKANTRLVAVMIMGDNRSLKNISTKYFTVSRFNTKNIIQIVEA